jgi:secreted Zn-dependent insulinase-like peptidase
MRYGMSYGILEAINSFDIPMENQFMPTDFSLKPKEYDTPITLLDDSFMKVRLYQDTSKPFSRYTIKMLSFTVSEDYVYSLCSKILYHMIDKALLLIYSAAYGTGIEIRLKLNIRSFELDISGFSDKLEIFVKSSLDTVNKFFDTLFTNPDYNSFLESKKLVEKSAKEIEMRVQNRMLDILTSVLEQNKNPLKEVDHSILQEITIKDIRCFASRFVRSLSFHVKGEGNITRNDIVGISMYIMNNFMDRIISFIDYQTRIVKIPKGTTVIDAGFRLERNTFALINYYQIGLIDKRNITLTEMTARKMYDLLLNQIMPCGIAHNAQVSSIFESNVCGILFYIQSDLGDPFEIDESIECFFKKLTEDDDIAKFEEYKEEAERYMELYSRSEEMTSDITREDFIDFIKKFIHPESDKRRKLSIIAFPNKYITNRYIIKDIVKFKKESHLYPST